MKKNVSSQIVGCQLVSKTDGSAVTSGTTTVYVTGDGGSQAAGSVGSGACTHEGHGFWTYAPAQAETNYDHVAFTFENADAINVTVQCYPTEGQFEGTAEGSYTYGDLVRITAAVAVGKTDITSSDGTATVVFRDVTDSSDIVTASVVGSERTSVTLNP